MELVDREVNNLLNKELSATEVRKEDDLYYNFTFWIKGKSVKDIKKGNFELIGRRIPTNYEGKCLFETDTAASKMSHRKLWPYYAEDDKPFNYYPRGRVNIYNGEVYINLHSLFNQPSIINSLIKECNLYKISYDVECNDETQGPHYNFLLR